MTDPSTDVPAGFHGRCLCGRVAYRLTAPLLGFQYCHCSRCRRSTGSAHAANCFAARDGVEWTRGGDEVMTFALDAEPGLRPQRAIFWGSRASWFVDTAELERFEEWPAS